MSQTCSQLLSQVRAFLQAPDDPELNTVGLAGMNSAVSLINSRTWKKIYGSSDIDLDAANAEYAMAEDFKEPIRLLMLDTSGERVSRIPFLDEGRFYEQFDNRGTLTGSPCCYTVDYASRVLLLDVTPGAGYIAQYPQLRSVYHRRVPKFTCTETSGLPEEFDDFIVARGAVWIARVRDPSKLATLRDEADERWRMLKADDGNTQTDY